SGFSPGLGTLWVRCRVQARAKRCLKGFLKTVGVIKVFGAILLGLSKDAVGDQVENQITKVAASIDPPMIEDRQGHRPKLLQRKTPYPLKQLWPADMPRRPFTAGLGKCLHGVVQRLPDKDIRRPIVAG